MVKKFLRSWCFQQPCNPRPLWEQLPLFTADWGEHHTCFKDKKDKAKKKKTTWTLPLLLQLLLLMLAATVTITYYCCCCFSLGYKWVSECLPLKALPFKCSRTNMNILAGFDVLSKGVPLKWWPLSPPWWRALTTLLLCLVTNNYFSRCSELCADYFPL